METLTFSNFLDLCLSMLTEFFDTVLFSDSLFGGDVKFGHVVIFALVVPLVLHYLIPTP